MLTTRYMAECFYMGFLDYDHVCHHISKMTALLIPAVLVIRCSFTCGHKIINVCLHETISVINSMTLVCVCVCVLQEKVRMRYKLTFILGDRQVTESGEIDKFPPVERWGHL